MSKIVRVSQALRNLNTDYVEKVNEIVTFGSNLVVVWFDDDAKPEYRSNLVNSLEKSLPDMKVEMRSDMDGIEVS